MPSSSASGTDGQGSPPATSGGGHEAAALDLLKALRRVDNEVGVRNSRIAFDIALVLYEAGPRRALSVDQLSEMTRYSGPTVRLVLKRLGEAGTTGPETRVGKTQFYALTAAGRARFAGYIQAIAEAMGPRPG